MTIRLLRAQKHVWDGLEINTFRVCWLTSSVFVISAPPGHWNPTRKQHPEIANWRGGGGGGKFGAHGRAFVLLLPMFIFLLFPLLVPLSPPKYPPDWEVAVLSWLILVGCQSRGDHRVQGWPIDLSGGLFRRVSVGVSLGRESHLCSSRNIILLKTPAKRFLF